MPVFCNLMKRILYDTITIYWLLKLAQNCFHFLQTFTKNKIYFIKHNNIIAIMFTDIRN